MKITKDTLMQIENIITSAKLVDVTDLIISNDLVRGINKAKTAFILSDLELPDDFANLAINRPDVYKSRFNLVKNIDDCVTTAKIREKDEGDFIEQIDFKSKSVKVQYRCCNPTMISAPKSINDKEFYTIKFSQEDVDMLNKASGSIDTLNIKIEGSEEGLRYELVDLSGDTITVDSESQIECEEDTFDFNFSFVQKPFLQLLKNCDIFEFSLGLKGVFKIKVNNIYFYLLPQV
jgi:hypothetical protein